ncbi:hypothetical protein V6N13_131289 [Hibiscus sabdariffa]
MGFLLCVEFVDVFILWISTVRVSVEVANLTVAVISFFIASPPVDFANADARVKTKSHELTRVRPWLSYKGFVDFNTFVIFLFAWYADNAFEMLGLTLLDAPLSFQVTNIEMVGTHPDSWEGSLPPFGALS